MEAADASVPPNPPPAAPVVVADVNEPLDLLDLLVARGVDVQRQRLAPADFVIGAMGIERKTVGDFHASMIDKRLFEQLSRLRDAYPKAALLLEGDVAFFEERRQPRASWGALIAIAVDMGVTILPTSSREASADLLDLLARRSSGSSCRGSPASATS